MIEVKLTLSEDVINALADAIELRRRNAEMLNPSGRNNSLKKWLRHAEAAEYLRKSPSALYKLTSTRMVKYTKRGKSNMYLLEDLDKYMEKGFQTTEDEIVNSVRFTKKMKNGR